MAPHATSIESAKSLLADLFSKRSVVLLGESHMIKENLDFVADLQPVGLAGRGEFAQGHAFGNPLTAADARAEGGLCKIEIGFDFFYLVFLLKKS